MRKSSGFANSTAHTPATPSATTRRARRETVRAGGGGAAAESRCRSNGPSRPNQSRGRSVGRNARKKEAVAAWGGGSRMRTCVAPHAPPHSPSLKEPPRAGLGAAGEVAGEGEMGASTACSAGEMGASEQ